MATASAPLAASKDSSSLYLIGASSAFRRFWLSSRLIYSIAPFLWGVLFLDRNLLENAKSFDARFVLLAAFLYFVLFFWLPYRATARRAFVPFLFTALVSFGLFLSSVAIIASGNLKLDFQGSNVWYEIAFVLLAAINAIGFSGAASIAFIACAKRYQRFLFFRPRSPLRIGSSLKLLLHCRLSLVSLLLLIVAAASAWLASSFLLDVRYYAPEAFGNFCVTMGYGTQFQHVEGPATVQCDAPWLYAIYGTILAYAILLPAATASVLTAWALRRMMPTAEAKIHSSRRRPILLLRSFDDDGLRVRPMQFYRSLQFRWPRLEQTLTRRISALAPVVAVGKPAEVLPTPGAFRAYFADEEWQTRITNLLESSKRIILIAGSSKGVEWELKEIVRCDHLSKTLIIIPPNEPNTRAMTVALLASNIPTLADANRCLKSDSLGIAFNSANRPSFIYGRGKSEVDYDLLLASFLVSDLSQKSDSGILPSGELRNVAALLRNASSYEQKSARARFRAEGLAALLILSILVLLAFSIVWLSSSDENTHKAAIASVHAAASIGAVESFTGFPTLIGNGAAARVITSFQEFATLKPGYRPAIVSEIREYYLQEYAHRKREQTSRLHDVKDSLALLLSPSLERYLKRAQRRISRAALDDAISDLNSAVEIDPSSYLARIERGDLFFQRAEFELAVRDYDRAVSLSIDKTGPLTKLAWAQFMLGRLGESEDTLNAASASGPRDKDVLLLRGLVRLAAGAPDQAMADFELAKSVSPSNSEVWARIGLVHWYNGAFLAAMLAFEKSLGLAWDSEVALMRYVARARSGLKADAVLREDLPRMKGDQLMKALAEYLLSGPDQTFALPKHAGSWSKCYAAFLVAQKSIIGADILRALTELQQAMVSCPEGSIPRKLAAVDHLRLR